MDIRNFVIAKIDKLRTERRWTVYKLSQETGINAQTIHNWFDINALPTVENISAVCDVFGTTLADFFSTGNLVEVTPEIKKLYDDWCVLTPEQQDSLSVIIKNYLNK